MQVDGWPGRAVAVVVDNQVGDYSRLASDKADHGLLGDQPG